MNHLRARLARLEAAIGPTYLPAFECWSPAPDDPDHLVLTDLMNPDRDGERITERDLAHRVLTEPRPYAMMVAGWTEGDAGDLRPSARRVVAAEGEAQP